MITYLGKKFEQLLDTLLEPVWQKILRASGLTRFSLLLLAAAIIASVTYPAVVGSAAANLYYAARGVFSDTRALPLRAQTISKLRASTNRLALLVRSDLASLDAATPWSTAQALYAIGGKADIDPERLTTFIRGGRDAGCSCWVEIPSTTTDQCIFISGWVLAALAKVGVAASADEVEFLLREQHGSGWWSTFPVRGETLSASAYATAWALLGLHEQRTRNLIPQQHVRAVELAIQNATTWLLSTREKQARWKPYPTMMRSAASESISGVVLHALHLTAPGDVAAIDKEWLDNLPPRAVATSDHENSYVEITTARGRSIDHFVQIKLPWLLVATVDAFPNGDRVQRARATRWLENQINQESVLAADTVQHNWWRAELLYSLLHTLEATEAGGYMESPNET
jgi:hypothetical protein